MGRVTAGSCCDVVAHCITLEIPLHSRESSFTSSSEVNGFRASLLGMRKSGRRRAYKAAIDWRTTGGESEREGMPKWASSLGNHST